MKKRIILSMVCLLGLMVCFGVTGCDDETTYSYSNRNVVKYFEGKHFFLDAGQTAIMDDIDQLFKHSGININHYKMVSSDDKVATIDNGVITAKGTGLANIIYTLYDKSSRKIYDVNAAFVYVVNEADMIPVRNADELANINYNLSGNYILKADIDLKNWKEWKTIGTTPGENKVFKGMFVNRGGYKIKNLNILSDSENNIKFGGLFGTSYGYIDGVILENVKIDLLMCESSWSFAGGIADSSWGTIANCSVSGEISTKLFSGGICGENYGNIINCNFEGIVNTVSMDNDPDASSGGIAAYSYPYGLIRGCNAKGRIITWIAGGILGFTREPDQNISRVENCSFDWDDSNSQIDAPVSGWIVGWRKDRPASMGRE